MHTAKEVSSKIWNIAHLLREHGLSYNDYLEQITLLLFIKLSSAKNDDVNSNFRDIWNKLVECNDRDLPSYYSNILSKLGKEDGFVGLIYKNSKNLIDSGIILQRIIKILNEIDWNSENTDIKGDIYEDLLDRNTRDVKSGAGQYFTPRPLIDAIVRIVDPSYKDSIADPACGTGGFLISAAKYINDKKIGSSTKRRTKQIYYGADIVQDVVRLCAMNMFIYDIDYDINGFKTLECVDSLTKEPNQLFDIVFANPPFGRSGFISFSDNPSKSYTLERRGFFKTSNKQLNFLQHIISMLKINGTGAIIIPDNVLFESGSGEKIRRRFLETCDVHTLVRLPTGIFYAQGVKCNIIFFKKGKPSKIPHTKEIWVYDFRTKNSFSLVNRKIRDVDLDHLVDTCKLSGISQRVESEKFKRFSLDSIINRDKVNLDIVWDIDPLDSSSQETDIENIIKDLQSAIESLNKLREKF